MQRMQRMQRMKRTHMMEEKMEERVEERTEMEKRADLHSFWGESEFVDEEG